MGRALVCLSALTLALLAAGSLGGAGSRAASGGGFAPAAESTPAAASGDAAAPLAAFDPAHASNSGYGSLAASGIGSASDAKASASGSGPLAASGIGSASDAKASASGYGSLAASGIGSASDAKASASGSGSLAASETAAPPAGSAWPTSGGRDASADRHLAPVSGYRLVNRFPHDPGAFTQGLILVDGQLIEATGHYGRSALRRLEIATGEELQRMELPPHLFGEGILRWGETLVQVTWREGLGLIHDLRGFRTLEHFPIAGEGWGLTEDGRHWILSDGTPVLRFIDPATRQVVRRLAVRDGGRPVARLNELEYVDGEIWANLWGRDELVRIDPDTGAVVGYIDLRELWPKAERPPGTDVLNGIAWDPVARHLFVTGKYWPWLFEIAILPPEILPPDPRLPGN